MQLSRTKAHVAFGGAVTFHMLTYRAARMSIALDELQRAYPAVFGAGEGKQYKQLVGFIFCFGRTWDIEFRLTDESPEELIAFRDWWVYVLPKGDYRAAYHSYTGMPESIMNAWAEAAEATSEPSPTAPPEMQAGAAERAKTDEAFSASRDRVIGEIGRRIHARVQAVIEQEDRLKAMREAKQDTDLAILAGRPPELNLTRPEPLIYEVWLEWQRTGRHFDSSLPPEAWDMTLRDDVRSYDYYWSYTRAYLKRGS